MPDSDMDSYFINRQDLYDIAQEYCDMTERYDRSVCKGPKRNGIAFPRTAKEHGLVNRNARILMKVAIGKAEKAGYTEKELRNV